MVGLIREFAIKIELLKYIEQEYNRMSLYTVLKYA